MMAWMVVIQRNFWRSSRWRLGSVSGYLKDLGPFKTFLGIQFERDYLTRVISIHQEMYIDSILAEHNLNRTFPLQFLCSHSFVWRLFLATMPSLVVFYAISRARDLFVCIMEEQKTELLTGLSDADWAGDRSGRASIMLGFRVVVWRRTYPLVGKEAELRGVVINGGGVCCPKG